MTESTVRTGISGLLLAALLAATSLASSLAHAARLTSTETAWLEAAAYNGGTTPPATGTTAANFFGYFAARYQLP